jgi:hypothetical protein
MQIQQPKVTGGASALPKTVLANSLRLEEKSNLGAREFGLLSKEPIEDAVITSVSGKSSSIATMFADGSVQSYGSYFNLAI